MDRYRFLPQPKLIRLGEAAGTPGVSALRLAGEFSPRLAAAAQHRLALDGRGRELVIESNTELKRCDEYRLTFAVERIRLEAGSERAAFYGLCTVQQMLGQAGLPATGEIHDWADLELRILMIDLKRVGWDFAYLLGLPGRIAELKINAVLMEYEDKVQFDFCDVIPVPAAFSKAQVRAFVAAAAANYLELIPLVQCLGHWEYILKHEKYAPVRELPGHVDMGCPSNPATFELFTAMAGEILDLHPQSRYFHIGADETRLLGQCATCQAKAAGTGKAHLYAAYVNRALAWVKAQGRTPLFWGDMLLNHPEVADLCAKDAIVVDWDYEPVERRSAKISFRSGLGESGELDYPSYRKLVPAAMQERFAAHVQAAAATQDFDSLPYGTYFQALGYRVLGASNINRDGNVLLHSDNAVRKGLAGNLATYWGAANSLQPPYTVYEGRWAGAGMLAASAWNSQFEWEHRASYYERFAAFYQGRQELAPVYRGLTRTVMVIPVGGPRGAAAAAQADLRAVDTLRVDVAALPHPANARLTLALARKCRLEQEIGAWRRQALSHPLLPGSAYRKIDLTATVNDRFSHSDARPGWSRDRDNDLAAMPTGEVCYQGIPFRVLADDPAGGNSVILVGARAGKPWYPQRVAGIRIGARARHLSFLHCLVEADPNQDGPVGRYLVHYADGSVEEVPLLPGRTIGGWWHAVDLAEAAVAWIGPNKRCPEVGIHCLSHRLAKPEVEIASVAVEAQGNVLLALAGLTAILPDDGPPTPAESVLGGQLEAFSARLRELAAEWRAILPSFVTPESAEELSLAAFARELHHLGNLRRLRE